ncbi:hypothetical protein Hdeb2414_s0020g00555181 [Helianthus debilis subsp. tardiflorus]
MHREVANCCRYLAMVLYHAGDMAEAIMQQHKELIINERCLGLDQPDTARRPDTDRQCGRKNAATSMVARSDWPFEPRTRTFATTILENMLYGKPDATMAEVEAAASAANAHSFITPLPNAAAMEFSKPSKPRVRYTRPWSPSALLKPLNRSGCRENHTNKHSCHSSISQSLEATHSGDIIAPSTLETFIQILQRNSWLMLSKSILLHSEVEVIMEFIHKDM